MHVEPLELSDLVTLVNDWGTVPRRAGHRLAPPTAEDDGVRPAVADRLHAVFAAAEPVERARLVTRMLAEAGVRPELTDAGGHLTAAWSVPEPRTALLASAALALRKQLAAHPDRLGVCADRRCADVYVDASPAGHRRFCSLTCQNRTRVAAFRERRRRVSDPRGSAT